MPALTCWASKLTIPVMQSVMNTTFFDLCVKLRHLPIRKWKFWTFVKALSSWWLTPATLLLNNDVPRPQGSNNFSTGNLFYVYLANLAAKPANLLNLTIVASGQAHSPAFHRCATMNHPGRGSSPLNTMQNEKIKDGHSIQIIPYDPT